MAHAPTHLPPRRRRVERFVEGVRQRAGHELSQHNVGLLLGAGAQELDAVGVRDFPEGVRGGSVTSQHGVAQGAGAGVIELLAAAGPQRASQLHFTSHRNWLLRAKACKPAADYIKYVKCWLVSGAHRRMAITALKSPSAISSERFSAQTKHTKSTNAHRRIAISVLKSPSAISSERLSTLAATKLPCHLALYTSPNSPPPAGFNEFVADTGGYNHLSTPGT